MPDPETAPANQATEAAKHTPGPWTISRAGTTLLGDGKLIADTNGSSRMSSGEAKANAALIAACPTMFDYCIKQAHNGDEDARLIVEGINEGYTRERE